MSVTVADVDEPLEVRGPTAVDYAENRTDAVATYTLDGTSAPVEWSLSGADGGEFSIDANGVLTFNRQPDYENPTDAANENAYLVTITAYAGEQSKTEFVRVRVTDVNEPPAFDEGETAIREVRHDAQLNSLIGEPVTATDPDKGASLTYTLPDAGTLPFSISEYTGQLSVSGTLAQNRPSYTVAVLVTDGADADGAPDTSADDRIMVTINVAGAGNDAPEFPSTETGARSFPENTTGVQNVGVPVAATDADDDTLTYTLGGTDASSFQIVSTSGQIQTTSGVTYDHEAKSSYSVTVTADDSNSGTDTKDVTITVTNLEEPGTVTLSTYQPSARSAVTATLSDPDEGVTGTTWQWAKSSDGRTGWSNVGTNSDTYTPPDGDLGSFLRATGSYTDGQGPNKTANAVTTHSVQSGSNRAPDFGATDATRSFPEYTGPGENIGDPVTATDPDTGNTLTYSLDATGAVSFDIDSTSGQIKTKSGVTYDDETDPTYSVTVTATDNHGDSDTIAVTITVTDANDPPTVTGDSTVSYAENRTDTVATYTASDPEGTSITWSLSGDDAEDFVISEGVLTFGATPNFEDAADANTDNVYLVTVEASDGSVKGTLDVTVTVTGVNEAPEFPATETGARAISENTEAGQPIGDPVEAEDPDVGDSLTYTLSGADAASFDIVTTSGQLQTKAVLDKETRSSYTVTVTASDGSLSDTQEVIITVTDANEPPSVSGQTSVSYEENRTDTVATYTASDPEGTSITWSLSGDDAEDFVINEGVLTFGATPNFEDAADANTDNVYLVTVEASDGSVKGTLDVTVTVTNVNEPPEFPSTETGARSVAENTAAGVNIGLPVSATDPDAGDTLTYTLGGTDAASFDIVTTSGQLQTEAALDHEGKASYEVTVSVRDSKDASGGADTTTDDTITVTITVTGENDSPEVTGQSSVDYAENGAADVATYTADDPEGTSITWSLSGNDSGDFSISNGGVLTFSTSPDYEDPADADTNNVYLVTIEASDGNTSGTLDVTVTVTNVNEAPEFPSTENGSRSIAENTEAGQPIGDPVEAEDPDAGETLTYTLSVTDAASFDIVATSGQLQTKAALDYETTASYEVTVSVRDSKDASGNTDMATDATITVTITVTNVNEPPEFPSTETGARSVAENTPASRDIGLPVSATDPDAGDTLTYTLDGTDASSFDIVTTSGQLQTEAALDHEGKASYEVTVSVRDSKDASGGADTTTDDTITVTITVTGENDPPEVTGRSSVDYAENGAGDVATYTADDPEGASIAWDLLGDDNSLFSISTLGVLTFRTAPDFEARADADNDNEYLVTVRASDGANIVTLAVTVTVTDENEPPAFAAETDARTIAENTAAGRNIGTPVSATDPDAGDTTLTYTLGGDDAASFGIVATSGQLQTKADLDHETKPRYSVTVTASDPSSTSATIAVTIMVTDENDPPEFPSDIGERSVAENTGPGEDIGPAVAATDADDATLAYTLGGADAASFSIVATSGQLQTKVALDHETRSSYTVTVTATDRSNASDTITVTITVTNVDEGPEVSGAPTRDYAENGTDPVATYTVTNPENGQIAWSLLGDDSADFSINGGVLAFNTPPNHEAPADADTNNVYLVTIKASDGNNADTLDLTVTVTNVDETPEVTGDSSINYAENGAGTVAAYTAPDPEGASITWSLSGDDSGDFSISITGELTFTTSPDYEAPADADTNNVYQVTIEASDGTNTGTLDLTVTVTNVNEQPAFAVETDARIIAESPVAGRNVGTPVSATDPDAGDTLTYELGGADASSFDIIPRSGQLKTKAALDYEAKKEHRVTVSARDSKDAADSDDTTTDDTITVTVFVTDVDEPPVVTGSSSINYAENGTETVATYTADDPEGNTTVDWTLGGADYDDFSISNGGVLTFKTSPNYEAPADADGNNVYQVTIKASDGAKTGNLEVTVTVTDENELPAFASETDARTIAENTAAGQDIGTPVSATDPDAGETLTYTLGGTDAASFDIVVTSGLLQTKAALDHEGRASYTVTLSVRDSKDSSGNTDTATDATITVTITVTNVNEPPEFPSTETGARQVDENTAAGQNIGAPFSATDPDAGETLTYSLGGTDAASFDIVATSGQLRTKDALNYEIKSTYTVTVTATDREDVSDTIEVTITVINVDEPPVLEGKFSINYAENGTGTVAAYTAVDPENVLIAWSLSGDDSGDFSISSAGVLTFDTSPDYEAAEDTDPDNVYLVTVQASDGVNTVSLEVTVTVTDENETPVVTGNPLIDYPENGADPVATYTADDPENAQITWSLSVGDDSRHFSISNAGVLTFDSPPDYEAPASDVPDNVYLVEVRASDGTNTGTLPVAVTVTNVNEPPAFAKETATRTIAENPEAGVGIGMPVSATDQDDGDTLTYTLGGHDAGSFDIVATSGQLQTKATLDSDAKASYTVTVSVRDSKDTSGVADTATDATITVTIDVTNVNEPPVVTGEPSINYAENGAETVATYTAADPENSEITWSLSGDDAEDFSISIAGELTFSSSPDYEDPADADTNNVYLVTIKASDGNNADTLDLTVTVIDENEPPAFAAETAAHSIAENTASGQNIGTPVPAIDPDAGDTLTLTYTLGGADEDSFSIVATSGQLQTRAALDHETKASYTVTVTTTDPEDASDTITVTITVTDENETPEFPSTETGDRQVAENTVAGEDIGAAVAAIDPDAGDTLTYTLGGPDAASFGIIATSGQLQTKAALDYETKDSYTVTVTATDPEDASATITVTITVTNIDESGTVTLSSAQPRVYAAFTATLTDPDGSISDVTWQWESSSDGSTNWTAIGGATAATYTPAAGYAGNYLRATASYTDGEGHGKSAQEASAHAVRRPPASNRAPEFPSSETGARSVAENTVAGTNIGRRVGAVDRNTLTYTLGGPDASSFGIIATSGQLQTKAPLDHESKASYTVTVTATDPSNAKDVITITITVTNVDETPVVTVGPSIKYAENGIGTVATYTATDPEGTAIIWSLSGVDSGPFSISSAGALTFNTPPDYEDPADANMDNVYLVTVEASDGTVTGALEVTVTVTDEIETSELPSTETGGWSVKENTVAETNIGSPVVVMDDADDTLTYTLGGDDAASFGIIATSGQLQTKAPLDYESKASYTVTVTATDPGDASATITVTITVTNIDESGTVTLSSGQPKVYAAFTATLTDPDGSISDVTWQWESSSDGSTNWTAIGGATAATYTPAAGYAGNYLRATASYTDGEGHGKSAQEASAHAVRRPPASNRAPEFPSSETGARSVADNTPAGRDIGLPVSATDPDAGDTTLTYTLGGDDAASFGIVPTSGQLQTKVALDHETRSSYTVMVTATDRSNASDTITVTISVTNVNEGPEVSGAPTRDYAENGTDPVATYTVTNPENGQIAWSLLGGDSADFSINGGVFAFNTPPDHEAPADADTNNVYLVTIKASDGNNADTLDLTITVTNVDETPEVTGDSSINYAENGAETVAAYTAHDPEGASITWSLSGNDSGDFSISITGKLTFTTPPDYEAPADADTNNVYQVTIEASDGPNTGTLGVTVTVTNESETSESPSTETGGWSVKENTVAETNIGSPVMVMDDADDTLTYTLGGPDAASFGIIASSGQLQTKAPLDYETKASYSVEVTAKPPSGVSETIPVTIMVEDVSLGEVGDRYDTDRNEKINKQEAIEAVRDYFKDRLSKEDTIGVIRLYFRD